MTWIPDQIKKLILLNKQFTSINYTHLLMIKYLNMILSFIIMLSFNTIYMSPLLKNLLKEYFVSCLRTIPQTLTLIIWPQWPRLPFNCMNCHVLVMTFAFIYNLYGFNRIITWGSLVSNKDVNYKDYVNKWLRKW